MYRDSTRREGDFGLEGNKKNKGPYRLMSILERGRGGPNHEVKKFCEREKRN